MPSRRTKSRQIASWNVFYLGDLLRRSNKGSGVFDCSNKFLNTSYNPDDEMPLEVVEWNEKTLRYVVVNKLEESDGFTLDDAILQALVMLFLMARIQYGWGREMVARQLSIFGWGLKNPTSKTANKRRKPSVSDDVNLWHNEIEKLVKSKKLGPTTLDHYDNYDGIIDLYCYDTNNGRGRSNGNLYKRKSKGMPGQVHSLSEQASIQWALHSSQHRQLAELSAIIIKLLAQPKSHREDRVFQCVLCDILLKEAEKDNNEIFCKNVLEEIECTDWEAVFERAQKEEVRIDSDEYPLENEKLLHDG